MMTAMCDRRRTRALVVAVACVVAIATGSAGAATSPPTSAPVLASGGTPAVKMTVRGGSVLTITIKRTRAGNRLYRSIMRSARRFLVLCETTGGSPYTVDATYWGRFTLRWPKRGRVLRLRVLRYEGGTPPIVSYCEIGPNSSAMRTVMFHTIDLDATSGYSSPSTPDSPYINEFDVLGQLNLLLWLRSIETGNVVPSTADLVRFASQLRPAPPLPVVATSSRSEVPPAGTIGLWSYTQGRYFIVAAKLTASDGKLLQHYMWYGGLYR